MARIAGVTIPRDKRIEVGLTYVYGIGKSRAREIVEQAGVDPDTKVKDLTDDEEIRLRGYIEENVRVEGDLRRERNQNVKRLMEIGCYRGIRHRKNMPVRGQRTKTNARVRKGHKPAVGMRRKTKA